MPLPSLTSINKLQVMQNAVLRTNTGYMQDTNIQHMHDDTLALTIYKHLQHYFSQYKQKTQHPSHPFAQIYNILQQSKPKNTIFNNGRYTTNIPTDIETNMLHIYISISSLAISSSGDTSPPHSSQPYPNQNK